MKKLLSLLLCSAILFPSAAAAASNDTEPRTNAPLFSKETSSISRYCENFPTDTQLDVKLSAKEGDTVTVYLTADSNKSVAGLLATLNFNIRYFDYISTEPKIETSFENRISKGFFYYSFVAGPNGIFLSDNQEIVGYTFSVKKDIDINSSYMNFVIKEYYDTDLEELPHSDIGYKVSSNANADDSDSESDPVSDSEAPVHVHTPVVDEAVEPTCTSTGLTEGSHCSECGEIIVAQQEIPILDHTIVIDPAVEPTCTSTGLTEGSHCSVCSSIITPQSVVEMLPHTEVIDPAVPATEYESGLTEGSHCSVCGTVIIPQEYIPPLGHTHTIVIDPAVEPTCTSTGLTEGSHCSECGEIIVPQTEIPMTPHEFVDGKCIHCGALEFDDEYIYGDIDFDGELTANDAVIALRGSIDLVEFSNLEFNLADVDKDGEITANDAIIILQASIGLNTGTDAGNAYKTAVYNAKSTISVQVLDASSSMDKICPVCRFHNHK